MTLSQMDLASLKNKITLWIIRANNCTAERAITAGNEGQGKK